MAREKLRGVVDALGLNGDSTYDNRYCGNPRADRASGTKRQPDPLHRRSHHARQMPLDSTRRRRAATRRTWRPCRRVRWSRPSSAWTGCSTTRPPATARCWMRRSRWRACTAMTWWTRRRRRGARACGTGDVELIDNGWLYEAMCASCAEDGRGRPARHPLPPGGPRRDPHRPLRAHLGRLASWRTWTSATQGREAVAPAAERLRKQADETARRAVEAEAKATAL